MISLLLSCSEFPDNSFFVLNFVDKWEVYVSVDDKMSVVIAFEKLKFSKFLFLTTISG